MQHATSTIRVHGLDTLRALAVTLVVLHHYVLFVSHAPTFGWIGDVGWVGVDLFFALSGYLIGNQIFAAMKSPGGFSLRHFYARRLLRTLPNYWVVLALYFLWPAFRGQSPLLPLLEYLSFIQNIGLEPGSAFSHSWSLAIEEQFYLVLPALALLGAAFKGSVRLAWVAIALAFVAGMLVRADLWQELVEGRNYKLYYYFKFIYYSSLCRVDELLAGVALALLRNHHPGAWRALTRHGNLVGLAGLVVCGATFWWFLADRYGFFVTVYGFPLLALGFSLLIVSAVAEGSLLRSLRVPGAGALALWSYAIYLLHKQVCVLGAKWMAGQGYGTESLETIVAMLALSVGTGWLLYKLVETPFMWLRERYVPSNALYPASAHRIV
ncbi:acyltransferase family protein [Telluria aromaticivorans]|uniref:Acyltransferase n=1 Tax=Telluria aromaticivorans TaxID=2725995 RepID=A0A7Y2NZN1_9BURK|nr:acyltransferase [Telluria aromaticivorans]NNG23259.1 acyltransferase [Telluria aromaticivorans]